MTKPKNIHSKVEILKAVFTHKYWLAVTLAGAFFCFFGLNRGGVVVFIEATFIFLILNVLAGQYRLKTIPAAYWITCLICAYVLLVSILVSPHGSHYRWMRNVPRMLALIFGMHCLYQKKIDVQITVFFGITVSLAVCWQFAVLHLCGKPAGTFPGTHQLASFAVLVLPIIFYFFWITNGWYRYLWIVFGLMAIDLLLQTGSRPAFAGITFGSLFVMIFLVKGRYKWFGLTLIFLTLVVLFVTDYADFVSGLKEFIDVLPEEERIQMWGKACDKIMDNSLLNWIFGNGIGYFEVVYTRPGFPDKLQISPHNYFLNLLYSNGITGFILITVGFTLLISSMFKAAGKNQDIKIRVLSKCLITVFITWLFICGLNFALYSKYSQYPLAFILGPMLVVIQNKTTDNPVMHASMVIPK